MYRVGTLPDEKSLVSLIPRALGRISIEYGLAYVVATVKAQLKTLKYSPTCRYNWLQFLTNNCVVCAQMPINATPQSQLIVHVVQCPIMCGFFVEISAENISDIRLCLVRVVAWQEKLHSVKL